ncbi:uncharacterized protein LOC130695496 [Daphnia carinata]|uniref:uncharacterized protein LOC130695496 n=1 Tax=Daphnia carinata TaxID=120202 RepID=UPI00257E035B|nr:uncharacterized protein LOC130695496 [Daphnia carinata]
MLLLVQVFVVTSILIVHTHCLNIDEENITYTDIQSSNLYCHSSKKNTNGRKVVCDFRHTAAKLGNAVLLKENDGVQDEQLYLEVHNCSKLFISSAFYSWRRIFTSLHLTIGNVDDVEQEDVSEDFDQPLGGFISLALRNVKMNSLAPYLVSDTKVLQIDIQGCQIGIISENAFRNVDKLWQLRIVKSNISRIENRAMPNALLIEPRKVVNVDERKPFIFDETRFGTLESDAIQLNITEKNDYFNIISSQFLSILKGGIRISGSGHVLVVDSQFHQMDNDSVVINLRGADPETSHKLLAYSTLTLMGLDIFSVNVDNFLRNLQITNGEQYLMRLNFRFPGALSSVVTLDNNTLSHIWNPNRKMFVQNWTVVCNCHDIVNSLYALDDTGSGNENQDFENGTFSQMPGELDEAKPTEAFLTMVSSPNWPIPNELRCYKDDVNSVSMGEYSALFCTDNVEKTANTKHATLEPDQTSNNYDMRTMFWCLGITGGCVVVTAGIVCFVAIVRHRRKSCKIHNKKISAYRHNDVKQVGVISEDPICGCDEGEEESQL